MSMTLSRYLIRNEPVLSFFNLLNSQHKNMKFTTKKSCGTLSVLDTELKIKYDNFDSWFWRKVTNTGVFLNFKAIGPLKWKTGLVFCVS